MLYKLNEREAIKMDPNSTKRPMAQRTTLAFIKKKRTDEENLLEMTAATNSNVESSMVSAASNIQSRTNVESLVDRKCLAKVHEMAYLSLYIFKISWGGMHPDPTRGSCLRHSICRPSTISSQPSTLKLNENPEFLAGNITSLLLIYSIF